MTALETFCKPQERSNSSVNKLNFTHPLTCIEIIVNRRYQVLDTYLWKFVNGEMNYYFESIQVILAFN